EAPGAVAGRALAAELLDTLHGGRDVVADDVGVDAVLAHLRLIHALEDEAGAEPGRPFQADVRLLAVVDLAAEELAPEGRQPFRVGAVDDNDAEDDVRVIGKLGAHLFPFGLRDRTVFAD